MRAVCRLMPVRDRPPGGHSYLPPLPRRVLRLQAPASGANEGATVRSLKLEAALSVVQSQRASLEARRTAPQTLSHELLARDGRGLSLAHLAALDGDMTVLSLIERARPQIKSAAQADLDALLTLPDRAAGIETPLHYAALAGHQAVFLWYAGHGLWQAFLQVDQWGSHPLMLFGATRAQELQELLAGLGRFDGFAAHYGRLRTLPPPPRVLRPRSPCTLPVGPAPAPPLATPGDAASCGTTPAPSTLPVLTRCASPDIPTRSPGESASARRARAPGLDGI